MKETDCNQHADNYKKKTRVKQWLSESKLQTNLSHDSYGRLASGLGDTVLHQVEHVLVIQQADQVEGAKASSAAQRQISDHHGATEDTTYLIHQFIIKPFINFIYKL